MRKLLFTLSLLLPFGLYANHVVKMDDGKWTLIGVTGIYTTTSNGAGTEAVFPDFGGQHLIVEIADVDNNITWDRNTSISDFNHDATLVTGSVIAGIGEDVGNPTRVTDGATLGLPTHSTFGVRAIPANGSLVKVGAVIDNVTKNYTSPMRTMYIKSPYSNGAPDVMVIYQSNLQEGQSFKISFKNTDTEWDFRTGDDLIYRVVYNQDNTYDNPVDIRNMDPIVTEEGEDGDVSGTRYPMFIEAFDMNILDNINEIGELNTSNFQSLEGNLTVYQYQNGIWNIGRAESGAVQNLKPGGLTDGTIKGEGRDDLADLIQTTSPALRNFEAGYGYWARVDVDAGSTIGGTPGFLVDNAIVGASSYEGKLNDGWNLLSFPDGSLRYATSGFAIPMGDLDDTVIVGPFGETRVATGASCETANTAIDAYNKAAGAHNRLDVRCYAADSNATAVLISDKQFFISGTSGAVATPTAKSLAGKAFTTSDLEQIIDSTGAATEDALRTRYGEYALAVEYNQALADSGTDTSVKGTLVATLPSFTKAAALSMPMVSTNNATAFAGANSGAFDNYISGSGYDIEYDTVKRGQILALDSNSSSAGSLLLFAANNRFNLRDATFIRKVSLEDINGSQLNFAYNGNTVQTAAAALDWSETNATVVDRNCGTLSTAIATAVGGAIEFVCLDDMNTTGMFIAGGDAGLKNYDVREANTSARLIWHDYVKDSGEANASVYGAGIKVYQARQLAKAGWNAGNLISASSPNLTYSPIWADDFPMDGALYYMAENGFKPEMFITAVTDDTTDTISWKALDTTRNPKEWFDSSNDFELFWTERERGYWVYLANGYTNPVTVDNPTMSSYVINKHFNNNINAQGIGKVFNWMDGTIVSRVGGLVRNNYTSGESYNVEVNIGGVKSPMLTTGAVSSGKSNFTLDTIDFEVPSLRPDQGPFDVKVTAVDGIGGKELNEEYELAYIRPAVPAVEFDGTSLVATSNEVATSISVYEGNISDITRSAVLKLAATGGVVTITEADLGNFSFPAGGDEVNASADMKTLAKEEYLADLRVIAINGSDDTKGIFSDMRQQYYAPIYSKTARLTLGIGEQYKTVKPALYNVTDSLIVNANDAGVQFATGSDLFDLGSNNIATPISIVFQPIASATLDTGVIQFFTINLGTANITVGYMPNYIGKAFYLYDGNELYYGVFPTTNALQLTLNDLNKAETGQAVDSTATPLVP